MGNLPFLRPAECERRNEKALSYFQFIWVPNASDVRLSERRGVSPPVRQAYVYRRICARVQFSEWISDPEQGCRTGGLTPRRSPSALRWTSPAVANLRVEMLQSGPVIMGALASS